MQVVVVNQVQVVRLASTAVFPGWVHMPVRSAMSMLTVPVAAAMSTTTAVMPSATGPK